jgi:hypothetical protein
MEERLMPTMEMLVSLLNDLAAERFTGNVDVDFYQGVPRQIHRTESLQKHGGAPSYRPAGLETRSASNPQ